MKRLEAFGRKLGLETGRLACIAAAVLLLASPAAVLGDPTMYKLGTATGGIAVYFNSEEETPTNVAYFRAQYNNSVTALNGAQFTFSDEAPDPNFPLLTPAAVFGSGSQFGFDLIAVAPTNTLTPPTFTGVDRTPPPSYALDPTDMGELPWGVSDYKSGGPGNDTAVIVNTLFAGESLYVDGDGFVLTEISGGFEATFTGTLRTDGLVHWYGEGISDTPWGTYGIADWCYFEGTLTYLTAEDHTPGMDFYAGSIDFWAVPEPGTVALVLLGGLSLLRRRR